MLHGDIETNPGPNKKFKPFTCCHWNVNSLTAHNMVKLSSIIAYNTIHKYDFIGISETFLDSSLPTDDRELSINGYYLIRLIIQAITKEVTCAFIIENLLLFR